MTDLNLNLSVVQAIHLHGDITERIARDRQKLALLISLRIGITDVPDMSEGLLAENIRNNEAVLTRLTILLYGGNTIEPTRDLGNWTPETLAVRKAEGKCATASGWCLVHDVKEDFGHYLATRPAEDHGHNPRTGIAYDD